MPATTEKPQVLKRQIWFPLALYERLGQSALENHRSIQGQVIHELTKSRENRGAK